MSENGAASPGRWQVTQLPYRIGATSPVKVTVAGAAGVAARRPAAAIARIGSTSHERRRMMDMMSPLSVARSGRGTPQSRMMVDISRIPHLAAVVHDGITGERRRL